MRLHNFSSSQTEIRRSFADENMRFGRRSQAWAKHSLSGMTLVEISIAVALLGLISAAAIATLMSLNKNAASTRVMTSVKEIVQRNIESAIGTPFTSTNVPTILALTSSSGSVWDEGPGTDLSLNQTSIYKSRDATSKITGTLTRFVSKETNVLGADIRRVTFHLDYKLFGRQLGYEMTTIRAMDR